MKKLNTKQNQMINVSFRSKSDEVNALKSMRKIDGPIYKDQFTGGTLLEMNFRRTNSVYSVPIDSLRSPDFVIEQDEVFVSIFAEFLRGRANGYATRVLSTDILEGYFTSDVKCERKIENTPQDQIDLNCAVIRAGGRPSLWVRENFSFPDAPRFFHSDGIAVLKAYRQLGFVEIPVIIVSPSPPLGLRHSSFVIGHGGPLKDPVARVEDFLACEIQTIPAILKAGALLNDVLLVAIKRLTEAIESLRTFHQESDELEVVHYHDSVFSTLVRALEHLQAIEILVEKRLWSPIPNLQRSLYELSLMYYVDWLAPNVSYFGLSVAASLDGAGIRLLEDELARDFSKTGSPQKAKALAKRALKFVRWVEKVSNKAAFAPIGIALHEKFYSSLCSTAHQDFSQTTTHANRFRNTAFEYFDEEHQHSLADFLNVVVGTIYSMTIEDIPVVEIQFD